MCLIKSFFFKLLIKLKNREERNNKEIEKKNKRQ